MNLALSVVLPSYLEEENLRLLLPRLKMTLDAQNLSYEVVVIDTELALDQTKAVCHEHHALYFNREGGNLYGDAVRTGIKVARGEFIAFMDADGSHPPEFIPQLLKGREASDVVIASRYIQGGFTENSQVLVIMSRILNWTYSLVLGLNCKDVSNSFKLYRRDYLHELDLVCNQFDIVEEILFKMQRKHRDLRILEVPFTFKKRMFGETKRNLVLFILTYVTTMIKLWLSTSPVAIRYFRLKRVREAQRKL